MANLYSLFVLLFLSFWIFKIRTKNRMMSSRLETIIIKNGKIVEKVYRNNKGKRYSLRSNKLF